LRAAGAEREAADLLIEAGAVLSSSLDVGTTMRQVAALTVPSLADLCVIDLCDDDGSIADVAVAAREPGLAPALEAMRRDHPLDLAGPHPVAGAIREGKARLLAELDEPQLRAFAADDEHARFMLSHGYRSAIVAPLSARARTLGAISVLRFAGRELFEEDDLELTHELARRAALALDNARLFGELLRLESTQQAILAGVAEAITVEDVDGRTVFANQAAADLLGMQSPDDVTSAERDAVVARLLLLDEQSRELDPDDLPGRRVLRGEPAPPRLVRSIVRASGEERWLTVRASPIAGPVSGEVRFAVNVFENITDVKRAQLGETFMAQASRVLASSMDYRETLGRVARLAVPQLADWCAIDLVNETGEIELVAIHHADPGRRQLVERLARRYRRHPHEDGPVPEVIRTGLSRLVERIDPREMAAMVRDEEHLQLLEGLGATSSLTVPLASAVETIGAVSLVTSESPRRLSQRDVTLAERLGRRAGTAVENARLYTERGRIAHTLQRALLPEALPAVSGADVQARYQAAGELNEVGGDFYDVFRHGEDGWILVIGDVVGKGARAASVTALARHTLRAASMTVGSLREMLDMLHRALRAQPTGADLCTVCLVRVDGLPAEARMTIALAGHPPPLCVERTGAVRGVGRAGTLLGVFDPVRVHEIEAPLEPGETLLLYTDGVLDAGRRRGAPLGELGLVELCRQTSGAPLGEMLARIERAALDRADAALRDDIALLALRRDAVAQPARGAPARR
jgi:PAS domain S-box-containing protein